MSARNERISRLGSVFGPPVSVVLMFLVMAVAVGGCERQTGRSSARLARGGTIGFVGAFQQDPLWGVLRATAEREIALLGSFRLRAQAPEVESPSAQINLIRKMHAEGIRGLCVQPVDPIVQVDYFRELRANGVAVVTMLNSFPPDAGFPHVGLDEMAVGKSLADAVADAVGGRGTVAVLHNEDAQKGAALRYIGFNDALALRPAVSVLRRLDCGGNEFVAQRLLSECMERYPRLNAWVSLENWPLAHLEPDKRLFPETCRLVTCGPFPQFWPRIADGTCYALIGAEYDQVVVRAIGMCTGAVQGEVASVTTYSVPPLTVTGRNLSEFKLQWFRWREMPESRDARDP